MPHFAPQAKHAAAIIGRDDQFGGGRGGHAVRPFGAAMGTYRLIAVDFDGPLLLEPQTFTAVNDDDAVAKARNILRDHDIELWDGERLVMCFRARER